MGKARLLKYNVVSIKTGLFVDYLITYLKATWKKTYLCIGCK